MLSAAIRRPIALSSAARSSARKSSLQIAANYHVSSASKYSRGADVGPSGVSTQGLGQKSSAFDTGVGSAVRVPELKPDAKNTPPTISENVKLQEARPIANIEPSVIPINQTASTTTSGSAAPSAPPLPQARPGRSWRSRLRIGFYTMTVLLAGGFIAGSYYSTQNETFANFFTDYVPFGDEVYNYLQERKFSRKYPDIQRKIQQKDYVLVSPEPTRSRRVTDPVETPPTKDPLAPESSAGPHISAKPQETKSAPPKPVAPVTAPESTANTSASPATAAVPAEEPAKIIMPFAVESGADPVVAKIGGSLNSLIHLVNDKGQMDVFRGAIEASKNELYMLNARISQIRAETKEMAKADFEKAAEQMTNQQLQLQNKLETELKEQQVEFNHVLEEERTSLKNAFNEKLAFEIESQARVSEAKYHNELIEQVINLQRRWTRDIRSRVEEERGGRLAKLDQLQKRLKELELVGSKSADAFESAQAAQEAFIAANSLSEAVNSPLANKSFEKELLALRDLAAKDDLVAAALATINPESLQNGVVPVSGLADSFPAVAAEVRKVALLPDQAGVAGFASSWLLSKLLFAPKGMVRGSDVNAILARAEACIDRGDIDSAARNLNQLQGWAKVIASTWLEEARRHLEAKQAADIVQTTILLEQLRTA